MTHWESLLPNLLGTSDTWTSNSERAQTYLARDLKTVHCTDGETDSKPIFVRLATISMGYFLLLPVLLFTQSFT